MDNMYAADHSGDHEPRANARRRAVPAGLPDQRADLHARHADPGAVSRDGVGPHQAHRNPGVGCGIGRDPDRERVAAAIESCPPGSARRVNAAGRSAKAQRPRRRPRQRGPAQPDHVVQRHAGSARDRADHRERDGARRAGERASAHRPRATRRDRPEPDRRAAHAQAGRRPRPGRDTRRTRRHAGDGACQPRRSSRHRPPASPRRVGRPWPAQRIERVVYRIHPGGRDPRRQTRCTPIRSAETRYRAGLLPHRAGEPDERRASCRRQQGVA